MLAGDARTGPASREVDDERVDDLGVLAFAHVNTMTRASCPDNLLSANGRANQGKHSGQLSPSAGSNKPARLGRDRTVVPL